MKLTLKYFAAFMATCLLPFSAHADSNRLEQMISPGFSPVTFEDPRAISEARPIYLYHKIDSKFVTNGGNVNVITSQLRFAVDDKLSIIATKAGLVYLRPEAVVDDGIGFADLEAGLKYTLLENKSDGYILSGQFRLGLPYGANKILYGHGTEIWHPSFSGSTALTDYATFSLGSGLRVSPSKNDSSFWDLDAQLDYRIPVDNDISIYPLIGASLIRVINAGGRLPIADEGQDLLNFGATESGGENIITGVGGIRTRLASNLDVGVSLQFPLDKGTGSRVIDHRWMLDANVRF